MKERILILEGLNCASCAAKIENLSSKVEGVASVNFDFVTKKLRLDLEEVREDRAIEEIKSIVKKLEPDVMVIDRSPKESRSEKVLLLEGLNCASCAAKIEEGARKLDGVENLSFDFVTKKLRLDLEPGKESLALDRVEKLVNKLEPDVRVKDISPKKARTVLVLEGLNCASCAAKIEEGAGKLEGVRDLSLDFVTKKLSLDLEEGREDLLVDEITRLVTKLEPDVKVIRQPGSQERVRGRRVLVLDGLDCASCAAKIEDRAKATAGVKEASLDFVSKRLSLRLDQSLENEAIGEIKAMIKKLEPDVEVFDERDLRARRLVEKSTSCPDDSCSVDSPKKSILEGVKNIELIKIIVASILFFIPSLLKLEGSSRVMVYAISYVIVGLEIIKRAITNVFAGQPFDEYFLMTIATAGAFIIGEYPEGVMVMLLYRIGEYLQGLAVNRSRDSISSLMDIRPDYANLVSGDGSIVVDPQDVHLGDYILVKAGEKIPLDGVLVEGESSLDTSNITGEPVPRKVKPGDEILSGSVNKEGLLKIRVTKEFGDSTVSKVLDLVENASSKKAETENFITKFARYYTPAVVAVSVLIGLIIPLVFKYNLSQWAYKAFVFLVISCPCALVISVPLGFFGGIGGASKKGILVKGGNYLEGLNDVDTIVFDKTGTITEGSFEVVKIESFGNLSEDQILELAAYGEYYSNHPIGKSIVDHYARDIDQARIRDYKEISGKGIDVFIDGKRLLIGNKKLFLKEFIDLRETDEYGTVAYLAVDGEHLGTVIVADKIKDNIKDDLENLRKKGIKNLIMLSGDNSETAKEVANIVGLDQAYGDLLPQDKVEKFEEIIQSSKGKVAFVGDGVNDAPALARADIGIAMGGLGSDAAIEASDIVIMTDEIGKINTALGIAKKTKKIVTENIYLALGVKFIVLILGALGKANMWMAVFADVGVSIIAIFNSIRALKVED